MTKKTTSLKKNGLFAVRAIYIGYVTHTSAQSYLSIYTHLHIVMYTYYTSKGLPEKENELALCGEFE